MAAAGRDVLQGAVTDDGADIQAGIILGAAVEPDAAHSADQLSGCCCHTH